MMKHNFNNLTDEQLYDIALDDTIGDVSLRIEAVKLIEDEALLMRLTEFTIIDEADEKVACEAVRRIKSQELIAEIANDEDEILPEEVRSIAVCMLTDEKLLADFAKRYSNAIYDSENLGLKAVEKITNTELLKEIINDDGNYEVVCAAADKLDDLEDDKSVFERAALQSVSSNTRAHMVTLVTNQAVLKDFIINDNEVEDIEKLETLDEITDNIFLKDIVLSGYEFAIKAIKKITDQTCLKEIIIIGGDYDISIEAINKITDQLILRDIILSKDVYFEIKIAAINKITEQSILKDIVLSKCVEVDVEIKIEAVKRITNSSFVKEIISSDDIAVAIKMEINVDAISDEETLNSIDLSDSEDLFDDVD